MTPDLHPTIERFIEADERMDADALGELFTDDVVLISPITDAFRFEGRRSVSAVYASAFSLFPGIDVHTVTGSGDTWALFLRGTIGGRRFEECQLLRLDGQRIREVTMIGRPVPALLMVMSKIGGAMHERGLMSRKAAIASAGVAPMAALLGVIEKRLMPRLAPRRL
ncbi:nuclear transport factor 2 family protein [Blastococcus sp. Marseille-P5729]|uniref:nuclear transport factor 2 family protein n=1 Tax=Blastococcus sp. Marseille-P5729 TaxID=2086582 RepID=UPI000D0E62C8|nr:nuclear transport factor 2 family protein [Blastococcus sp. Marseille-P5729]